MAVMSMLQSGINFLIGKSMSSPIYPCWCVRHVFSISRRLIEGKTVRFGQGFPDDMMQMAGRRGPKPALRMTLMQAARDLEQREAH